MTLSVDGARLLADLHALGRIGRRGERGLFRPAFSEADGEARRWLCARAEAASLHVTTDGAANIVCRRDATDHRPAVIIGSHLDTVPGGGALDGALGVLVGLECLRRLEEEGLDLGHPVELVAFSDEEGRFGATLGSMAMAGALDSEALARAADDHGVPLAEAMESAGFDAAAVPDARRPAGSVRAYLELHIEQGPRLHQAGVGVGLLEGIAGLFRWAVCFEGQANHAGTTPMDHRRDALAGVVDLHAGLDALLADTGSGQSVATVGQVALEPGVSNVVAGRARCSLDVRDLDPQVLDALEQDVAELVDRVGRRRRLAARVEPLARLEPTACDAGVMDAIARSAAALGVDVMRLPSGAVHDAQNMARLGPMGMIFVPSIDGVSHAPGEATRDEDMVRGADVALGALVRLAR